MKTLTKLVAAAAMAASSLVATEVTAAAAYKHVLLISVDGLHPLDVANYVAAHPDSTFASLVKTGIFYPNALTTNPSDSFPGMLAQVTGGTPKTVGVFYDDAFVRNYFAPASDCKGAPGAETSFAENVDVDDTKIDGGGTPGKVMTQIDPKKLPMTMVNGKCEVVWPHMYPRVNNAFEIVKKHGGRTAWSDKHPAYEILNGPSGTGLDDFYALEQDSLIPGTDKKKTTASFSAERDFDEARVKALLNEINGMDSTGKTKAPVPALFGMNFQAVSVGQKLPKAGPGDDAGLTGGYTDASGTPSSGLALQLAYVDKAIGELISALRDKKLLDSTILIIASKHGQSPIDPASFQALDDDPYTKTPGYAFHIADDASLIWLAPDARKDNLAAAAAYLQKIMKPQGIGQVLDRATLSLAYQDPATDDRTPDFIVNVNPGVVYTGGSKIAEHGGMNFYDRSVALLVSNPGLKGKTVGALVQTTQVAPTILKALGYNPTELQAVVAEGTQELPSLPF